MKKPDKQAQMILHGSLTDFVSKEDQGNRYIKKIRFELNPSVKDILEARGIPHTAIFKIRVNDREQLSDYNIRDGDLFEAYPFEMVDTETFDSIFSSPSSFISDGHLSKLGGYLRLMGLDTVVANNAIDKEIIRLSNKEKRMILTRDLDLLKNGSAKYGYWVRSTDPDRKLQEVFTRFDLKVHINPFTRCMECNGELEPVEFKQVSDKVPPKVQEFCKEYQQCSKCGKVYWKGSHYKKLKKKVKQVMKSVDK